MHRTQLPGAIQESWRRGVTSNWDSCIASLRLTSHNSKYRRWLPTVLVPVPSSRQGAGATMPGGPHGDAL